MNRFTFIALLALTVAAQAAVPDISRTNGSIVVDAGQSVGDASTVNGAIHVGDRAIVANAHTVKRCPATSTWKPDRKWKAAFG